MFFTCFLFCYFFKDPWTRSFQISIAIKVSNFRHCFCVEFLVGCDYLSLIPVFVSLFFSSSFFFLSLV